MGLRSARVMTSLFLTRVLTRAEQVLLLYRVGSRAVPNSWVGIGGHVEPNEIRDPTACVLREVEEEIGVAAPDVVDLELRYVALRDNGVEIRLTYYFVASVSADVPIPSTCDEGKLRWFDVDAPEVLQLSMPPTTTAALTHWITEGHRDSAIRSILVTPDGARVIPFQPTAEIISRSAAPMP